MAASKQASIQTYTHTHAQCSNTSVGSLRLAPMKSLDHLWDKCLRHNQLFIGHPCVSFLSLSIEEIIDNLKSVPLSP